MQAHGVCCDAFTILQHPSATIADAPVSLRRIDHTVILPFLNYLEQAGPGRHPQLLRLQDATERLLALVLPGVTASLYIYFTAAEALNRISLALQILSMGLLSYVRGHAGPIEPFFLDTVVHNVVFLGSGHIDGPPADMQISARLTDLTCMSGLTHGSVLTFGHHRGYTKAPFDLFATPEDVIDTWGPARVVSDNNWRLFCEVLSIEIGNGVLSQTPRSGNTLHWQELSSNEESMDALVDGGRFSLHNERFMGFVDINDSCPLAQPGVQGNAAHACSEYLRPLGTTTSGWYPKSFQRGISAGKYVTLNFNTGFEKREGTTAKEAVLSKFKDLEPDECLSYLGAYYGLEVSLCTGVARRVPLRLLLADAMTASIDSYRFDPEGSFVFIDELIRALRTSTHRTWFSSSPAGHRKLALEQMGKVLLRLKETGLDAQGVLKVAWIRPNQIGLCLRLHCDERINLWAKILEDTEDCATFACITTACLETDNVRCQAANGIRWRSVSELLTTEVCRYVASESSQSRQPSQPFLLRENEQY